MYAHQAEAKFGLAKRGAASHQTEEQHHRADADDGDCWDQHLLVLNEAFEVVIALDHTGSDPSQHTAGGLEMKKKDGSYTCGYNSNRMERQPKIERKIRGPIIDQLIHSPMIRPDRYVQSDYTTIKSFKK